MAEVRVLILRAPGTNCDAETAYAFEQAGARTSLVHINRLIRHEERLADYQIFVIPGGFTYGDDLGAGKVLANELRVKLGEELMRFHEAGRLMMGICNGFQVMVKAGMLPEPGISGSSGVTLTNNDSGRFECRWVYLEANPDSPCIFTRGLDTIYLPVAHGEGKFVAGPEELPRINAALYYTDEHGDRGAGYPDNPNGSADNIAGICDRSGRVFALMPHPERHIRHTQHPRWTRLPRREHGDGLKIFANAVSWVKSL